MDASPQPPRSRIDWVQVFFSSTGRMGRVLFVASGVVVLAGFAAYDAVADGAPGWIAGWAAYPLAVFTAACVLSKRLHDRGRSGWWAAPVLWAFAVVWPAPRGVIDFVFALVLVLAAIELCLMPGEPGANRFGPPA